MPYLRDRGRPDRAELRHRTGQRTQAAPCGRLGPQRLSPAAPAVGDVETARYQRGCDVRWTHLFIHALVLGARARVACS
jgi:hypothetical protein